jgi:biopolymer transport protein ExbD
MALQENTAWERKRKSFVRNKKQLLRIDMTPMVDLGFLLITFFVFTTALSKPAATDLYITKDPLNNFGSPLLSDDLALTFLLDDKNKIYYYQGRFEDALSTKTIRATTYSTYEGLGRVIRERQKEIQASGKYREGSRGLMLLIKPGSKAVYKNVIDALDEVMINDVKKYAIVEPTEVEIKFLNRHQGNSSMTK